MNNGNKPPRKNIVGDHSPHKTGLPIDQVIPDVLSAVGTSRPIILQAEPGAGKTTGVPPALASALPAEAGRIVLIQPRRIAARAAATRLSQLADQIVGQDYGYHVRFDRKLSQATRVVAMTPGILLRQLGSDPLLETVQCVILDEFHERSIDLDLALGMLQQIRSELRPELQLIVMSATLDIDSVAGLLDDAQIIRCPGRQFPVEISYTESLSVTGNRRSEIAQRAFEAFNRVCEQTTGDTLIFLPGVGEILTLEKMIRSNRTGELDLLTLYGEQKPGDQDRVFLPSPRRKVILATNIAETSVTIDGITCVIDTGLARITGFDSATGIPRLELQPISKASADQRAGRAGRTAAGTAIRLWPQAMHRIRAEHLLPEILRGDLSGAVLTLACWGERNVSEFPWVTPPTDSAITAAKRLLQQLGAIDDQGAATELGNRMQQLPTSPRLARLLLAAAYEGCLEQAAIAAALLSERSPFERDASFPRPSATGLESDLVERVEALEAHFQGRSGHMIHSAAAKTIERVAKRYQQMVRDKDSANTDADHNASVGRREGLCRSLLTAYADRLALRREQGSDTARMVGGRGVRLARGSLVKDAKLFLCLDLQDGSKETLVRMASAVKQDWLPAEQLIRGETFFFDEDRQAVIARSQTKFADLILHDSPAKRVANEQTAALLKSHAMPELERILHAGGKDLQSLVNRWQFIDEHCSDHPLTESCDDAIRAVLEQFCQQFTSLKELEQAPWRDFLFGRLDYAQQQWLDQNAPSSLQVPSGNRLRVHYQAGKPPVLPVRIQEIYGWKTTPTLAGGRVTVQLHLLGPNHRPQQITDDLESFWKNTYPEIKKELKRRYSKHHWPDDPGSAQATSNGLKPRS